MFHSTPVRALLQSAILCFLTSSALAQFGASVQGTVTDKSGAVVSGANVTITEQATGASHSAVTDASGFYRINDLPPGTYRVDVQATSFKKSTWSDVVVSAEQPTPVNITMDTGSASETVTVTAAQETLHTEDATIQGTLTAKEVENLPEINRDPYELIRLAPGVFGDGARFGDGRFGRISQWTRRRQRLRRSRWIQCGNLPDREPATHQRHGTARHVERLHRGWRKCK